ncbi:MAG TPA: hypothetical protein VHV31_13370, partial [Nitrolancea sp.]|nr:hypothetical protein [Nitrolancea sp.]
KLFTLHDLVRFAQAFSSIEGAINRGSFAQLPLEIAFVEAVLPEQPTAAVPVQPAPQAQPERPAAVPPDSMRAVPSGGRSSAAESRRDSSEYAATPVPASDLPFERRGSSINLPPISSPAPPIQPAPASVSQDQESPALERLVASWTQIRRDVKTANARIAALLASTDPTVVRDTEIVLVSPYEFHRNKLNEDGARRVIEDVIARYMGRTYQMICVDASDSRSQARPSVVLTIEQPDPMTNGHHDEPAEPATPSADSDEDPRIRAAKSIFDATEVDSEG